MEVAQTYNRIAHDFSKTRYSVWGGVRTFLDALPQGSLVGDIGCGNGKNMMYKQERLVYEGVDISSEFVTICKSRGLQVKEGSVLDIPSQTDHYDHTMSIAVIHHLRTREERLQAIRELVRVTKPGGYVLLYVWAAEQPTTSKRKFTGGDTMVPFHMKDSTVCERFYHIYLEGELEAEIQSAIGPTNLQSFYDTGNWCVVINHNKNAP
jgi:SAM-dependent methyltransferase